MAGHGPRAAGPWRAVGRWAAGLLFYKTHLSMQITLAEIRANENCHANTVTGKCLLPKGLEFENLVRRIQDPRENITSLGYFFLIINNLRKLQTNQTE